MNKENIKYVKILVLKIFATGSALLLSFRPVVANILETADRLLHRRCKINQFFLPASLYWMAVDQLLTVLST